MRELYRTILIRPSPRSRAEQAQAKGFSLVEVLIAMALMSVVILATMGVLVIGLQRIYGGRKMTEATVLAQDVLQRVNRPAPYTLFNGAATDSSIVQVWEIGVSGSTQYQRTTKDALPTYNWAPGPPPTWETSGGNYGANYPTRNAIGELFNAARLPYGTGPAAESELMVRIDAVGGATFATARMARVQVQVRWSERGIRPRQARLESLTLPTPENP